MDGSTPPGRPVGDRDRTAGNGWRAVGYTSAALSALISASFVLATPTTASWEVRQIGAGDPVGGTVVDRGFKIMPVSLLFAAIQAVALAAAVTAIVIGLRGNDRTARRLLAVTAVAGLVPAVLPGLLAALAWYLLGRSPGRRPAG